MGAKNGPSKQVPDFCVGSLIMSPLLSWHPAHLLPRLTGKYLPRLTGKYPSKATISSLMKLQTQVDKAEHSTKLKS